MSLRNWNLPPGVDVGTWDYATSKSIANQYEDYFQDHPLFAVDQQLIDHSLPPPAAETRVADFGCGTGRALLPLIQRGYQGVAIDLSHAMLRQVRQMASERGLNVDCIHANLVQLDALADHCFDHGICLFSTLGMIKGRRHRKQALGHMQRTIRPGGLLILHVHNYWYNLFDPGGPWWLLKNRVQTMLDSKVEIGDKHYPYRGLTNMFLHVFTQKEIRTDLQNAGWTIRDWHSLEPRTLKVLEGKRWLAQLRTIGWIIVCQKS